MQFHQPLVSHKNRGSSFQDIGWGPAALPCPPRSCPSILAAVGGLLSERPGVSSVGCLPGVATVEATLDTPEIPHVGGQQTPATMMDRREYGFVLHCYVGEVSCWSVWQVYMVCVAGVVSGTHPTPPTLPDPPKWGKATGASTTQSVSILGRYVLWDVNIESLPVLQQMFAW